MRNEHENTPPKPLYLPIPPEPKYPNNLSAWDFTSAKAVAYQDSHQRWLHEAELVRTARRVAEKAYEQKLKDRAAMDDIVFRLEAPADTDTPVDMAAMLASNARALNDAFEYYMGKAGDSPKADFKTMLGIRMQSQLVRTIDAWRRLENFQNGKTK